MKETVIAKKSSAREVILTGLVAASYIVFTLVTGPLSFGLGIRISEGLNFLALYNKRHIWGITIGVFFVNYFAYGVWDMLVGSLHTLIALNLGVWLGEKIVNKLEEKGKLSIDAMLIKYIVVGIVFTVFMFMIAIMVVMLGAGWSAFWPLYISMMGAEALSLVAGGIIIYLVSKRVNLTQ